MCLALKDLVKAHPDIRVIYPVHMNPNVRSTINALLGGTERIHLTEPLDYITFVSLLRRCFLVLTDSGGIQEEAPTFHKPVLVLRKRDRAPGGIGVWIGQNHRHARGGNRPRSGASPHGQGGVPGHVRRRKSLRRRQGRGKNRRGHHALAPGKDAASRSRKGIQAASETARMRRRKTDNPWRPRTRCHAEKVRS